MEDALVSVIMPVYNRVDTIKRAVDSVLSQTYSNIELIVVDDGSTDNTLSMIQSYADDRIRILCQEHSGANKARNYGIANAKGDYIAFQDSDDEWSLNKLEIQMAFMETNGYLACFSPYYLYEEGSIVVIPEDYRENEEYHKNLVNTLKSHNVAGTPTLLLKKEVISLLHGEVFDETLPRLQEYEMLIRLVQLTDIGYIEEPLVSAYRDADNISNKGLHLYEVAGRILKKHGDFLDIRSFLNFYVIEAAEFEKTSILSDGIKIMHDIVGTGLVDLRAEMITYLHSRLTQQNAVLKKLYQAASGSFYRRRFVVYGTGNVAAVFYKKVCRYGMKPDGFIVTAMGESVPEAIDGISVSTAEDYGLRDILVVICVSSKYHEDVLDNLTRLGYSDICIFNDL